MALAKKCDGCGLLYESFPPGHGSRYDELRIIYQVMKSNTGEVINGSAVYDLCPECMKKFLKVIAKGENK